MNTTMNTIDFAAQLLNTLKTADETYLADLAQALERGYPILNARYAAAEPVKTNVKKAVKAVAEKKAVAKKKAVAGKPVPEAVDGAPTAASYRLAPAEIDEDKCVGRILKGGEDKRWKPVIYRESQCGKDVTEDGLCKTCAGRAEKYEGKAGAWNGRVTEEPLEVVHMLGTEWAEKKKPVFIGSASEASEASDASVAEASENESAQEMLPVEVKKTVKTVKATKAKPTDEEKEAAKAAKAAEKEAEKAAKAAAKEAEKAAKAAEKEAEKAAKAAEKAKAKAEKPKATKAKATPEAKVVETPVVEVTGEVRLIDDKAYFLRNGNVYNYCELDEEVGAFVGRINDDGSIDTEADEVKAPESETE